MTEQSTADRVWSIGDIERKNHRAGQYFFEPDTMRFFRSKVQGEVFGGRFFFTTEKGPDEIRRASIRMILDNGTVETVGEFGEFPSPATARRALEMAQAQGVEVRNDPYPDDIDPTNPRRFAWRAYVGELPIGCRTSKWNAQRGAAQAKRPATL